MKELRCKKCNRLLAKIIDGSYIKEPIYCNSCYVDLKILNNFDNKQQSPYEID